MVLGREGRWGSVAGGAVEGGQGSGAIKEKQISAVVWM